MKNNDLFNEFLSKINKNNFKYHRSKFGTYKSIICIIIYILIMYINPINKLILITTGTIHGIIIVMIFWERVHDLIHANFKCYDQIIINIICHGVNLIWKKEHLIHHHLTNSDNDPDRYLVMNTSSACFFAYNWIGYVSYYKKNKMQILKHLGYFFISFGFMLIKTINNPRYIIHIIVHYFVFSVLFRMSALFAHTINSYPNKSDYFLKIINNTNDWCYNSFILNEFLSGLNHQTAHHLVPYVHWRNLPEVS